MVSKDEQTAELQENKDGRKTQSCLQECCFSQATDKLKDRSRSPSGWGRAAEAAVERALSLLHCHGRISTLFPQLFLTLHTHLRDGQRGTGHQYLPGLATFSRSLQPLWRWGRRSRHWPRLRWWWRCAWLWQTPLGNQPCLCQGRENKEPFRHSHFDLKRPHLHIQKQLLHTPPMTLISEYQLVPELLYVGI